MNNRRPLSPSADLIFVFSAVQKRQAQWACRAGAWRVGPGKDPRLANKGSDTPTCLSPVWLWALTSYSTTLSCPTMLSWPPGGCWKTRSLLTWIRIHSIDSGFSNFRASRCPSEGRRVCPLSFHPVRTPELGLRQDRREQDGPQGHSTTGSARFQERVRPGREQGWGKTKHKWKYSSFTQMNRGWGGGGMSEGGSSFPANDKVSIPAVSKNHFWVFSAEGARV